MKKTISVILCVCIIALSFLSCKNDAVSDATILDTINYTYDSAYSFDEATVRAYKDLCEAVTMGQSEVRINSGFLDNVIQLFYTSFPLSDLVEKIEPSGNVYKISYKNNETVQDDVIKFIEKVHGIYQNSNESDVAKAVKIYNKIASSIKVSSNSSISCYDTIMKGEGTSYSYSNMFEYILQQNGIKAYHVLCEDMAGIPKAICAAELDGKIYYFDLFSEYHDNGGKLLKFFGMTTADAQNIGLRKFNYTNRQTAQDASDLRFQSCRFCSKWEIDSENLLITRSDGEIVQIALKL